MERGLAICLHCGRGVLSLALQARLVEVLEAAADKLCSMPGSHRLWGYAVHCTRGSNPTDAAKALAQTTPPRPSPTELLDWLNAIDDTGYRASLSILWDGFVRPTYLPLCVGQKAPRLEENHRSACFSETALNELARLISTPQACMAWDSAGPFSRPRRSTCAACRTGHR